MGRASLSLARGSAQRPKCTLLGTIISHRNDYLDGTRDSFARNLNQCHRRVCGSLLARKKGNWMILSASLAATCLVTLFSMPQTRQDAQAAKLLDEMYRACSQINTLQADTVVSGTGAFGPSHTTGRIVLKKPNLALATESGTMAPTMDADGKWIFHLYGLPDSYIRSKDDPDGHSIAGLLPVLFFFGNTVASNPLFRGATPQYGGEERVSGVNCQVIRLSKTRLNQMITLYIGPDHLIYRVVTATQLSPTTSTTQDEAFSHIRLNAHVPDSTFMLKSAHILTPSESQKLMSKQAK